MGLCQLDCHALTQKVQQVPACGQTVNGRLRLEARDDILWNCVKAAGARALARCTVFGRSLLAETIAFARANGKVFLGGTRALRGCPALSQQRLWTSTGLRWPPVAWDRGRQRSPRERHLDPHNPG